jgi:6-phosphogluconate dehydrogenase
MKNQIGVVGLAAMGSNLAMNFADHGFRTAVFNRSPDRTNALLAEYGSGKGLDPAYALEAFVSSLEVPRKIILMVKAGDASDAVMTQLAGLLEAGDILIDGGNSFFRDTIRRAESLREKGIRFVGMGISGGEEGARRGPSMMPGAVGDEWLALKSLVEAIAAKDFDGAPCVAPIGEGGAGHFVKMVHNGIEYADMQLIAEACFIMKHALGLQNDAIADVFETWNGGRLQSYLIEITAKILRVKEQDGVHLIDRILDTAGSKGTGKWTTDEALALGAPSFSIAAAVFARYASSDKEMRVELSKVFGEGEAEPVSGVTLDDVESALYAAKLLSYAQGYELLSLAAKEYGWNLDFKEISRIWQGGCIIRARFLRELTRVYAENPSLNHLLLSSFATDAIRENIASLRKVSAAVVSAGVPVPGFLSGLSYFDTMRMANGSASLIQAQRDYFGAHTFQRERGGEAEHFDWEAASTT